MDNARIMRWAGLLFLGLALRGPVWAAEPEVSVSEDEFKRLDTFEGVELAKADRAFAAQEYRAAGAQYDAFLLQFSKSIATPYALLRKARCVQLDNKRYDAIKAYTEVLDYFPNAHRYAGAALYYIGMCHWDNGDVKAAMKAWTEMANDVDYRKHFLAAGAINRLADNLVGQGKPGEAVAYLKQVAIDFRRPNPESARAAIDKVLTFYIRTQPDEARLREFYNKVEGFEPDPIAVSDNNYWERVRQHIRRLGTFTPAEKAARNSYYQYWATIFEGKNPTWDEFQFDWADFRRVYEEDTAKWIALVDQQFTRYQKAGDYSRINKWIRVFRDQKNKVQEYYAKLDFTKMTNAQIDELVRIMFDDVHDPVLAKNVYSKLKFDTMPNDEKYYLERFLWHADEGLVNDICSRFADPDGGKMELLRYYHWRQLPDKGIPLADDLTHSPQLAKEAFWLKAEMRQWQQKWSEAIAAYQSADNPPQNLFRIAECFTAAGKRDQAVAQYREIENFFKDQAPEAAMRIAYLYRDAGDQKQYIAALRGVMKKYPASGQSSTAHQESRRLGVKIGGGIDAE